MTLRDLKGQPVPEPREGPPPWSPYAVLAEHPWARFTGTMTSPSSEEELLREKEKDIAKAGELEDESKDLEDEAAGLELEAEDARRRSRKLWDEAKQLRKKWGAE